LRLLIHNGGNEQYQYFNLVFFVYLEKIVK